MINNISEITSYEYSFNIENNENKIQINGTYLNGETKFELDNQDYSIKDNIIINKNNTFQFDIEKITHQLSYKSLKEFISKYDYYSKTEYQTKDIKYEYNISNKDLSDYLNEEINNEENSKITIYENNYIKEIILDLSNLYQDKYLITIKYDNINNITSIDQNNTQTVEG